MPTMSLTPQQEDRIAWELNVYDGQRDAYENNAKDLKQRITDALNEDPRIHVHAISWRVKDRDSFERKLRKKLRTEPALIIEDVIGLRIITYFRDDAPWVERALRGKLNVLEGTYVNKAETLDDTEFGYRSIQFVATMPWAAGNDDLPELLRASVRQPPLSPAVVEIQIRSVVEHAWAEIEHDLSYHAPGRVSRSVRRRFALTAALVENVDEQLISIRNEVTLDRPTGSPDDTGAGFDVQRIIETDRASRALDRQIASALDLPLEKPLNFRREVTRALAVANLLTTSKVDAALAEQNGALGLRMAIVCASVERPLLSPDAVHGHEIPDDGVPRRDVTLRRPCAAQGQWSDSRCTRSRRLRRSRSRLWQRRRARCCPAATWARLE